MPKIASICPKMAPGWLNMVPRWPKIASICLKMAQYDPQMVPPGGPKNPAVAPVFVIKLVTFAN